MKTYINLGLNLALLILACIATPAHSNQDGLKGVVVVANLDQESLSLTKEEVRNLFLGNFIGKDLKVFSLPTEHKTRSEFNFTVIGLTELRLQSYWAKMRFTGRKKEPPVIDSEDALLAILSKTPNSVAYVSAELVLPEQLSVLYASR